MTDDSLLANDPSHIPPLFSGSCFFLGLVMLIAMMVWLAQIVRKGAVVMPLRRFIGLQLLRGSVFLFAASALLVLRSGRISSEGWIVLLPETLFFVTITVLAFSARQKAGLGNKAAVLDILRQEPVNIALIGAQVALFLFVSGLLFMGVVALPGFSPSVDDPMPYMIVGALWILLAVMLFDKARRRCPGANLHIQGVLLVIALALFLMMIPGLIQMISGQDMMHDFLHPLPRWHRA